MARLGTILVIDDAQNDIDLLLRAFQHLGIQNPVAVCRSGREAIDYLSDTQNPKPAVILVDLKMPGTDGFAVLNWIKTHPQLKDLIAIVLTSSDDIHDIRRAYAMGANSFLTKPVNLDDFRNLISAFHQYWIVANQPLPGFEGRITPNLPGEPPSGSELPA